MALKRHGEGFPFLLLASEVRLNVYRLVFAPTDNTSANTYHDGVHRDLHNYPNTARSNKADLALLLTCHKIHSEAYQSFCEHITFSFHDPIDFANDFLRTLPPSNLASIRHLKYRLPKYYSGEDKWQKGLVETFKIYRELSNLHCLILEIKQNWLDRGHVAYFQKTSDGGNEISDQFGERSLWDKYAAAPARDAALRLVKRGALAGFDIDGRMYLLDPDGSASFPGGEPMSKLVFNLILTKP